MIDIASQLNTLRMQLAEVQRAVRDVIPIRDAHGHFLGSYGGVGKLGPHPSGHVEIHAHPKASKVSSPKSPSAPKKPVSPGKATKAKSAGKKSSGAKSGGRKSPESIAKGVRERAREYSKEAKAARADGDIKTAKIFEKKAAESRQLAKDILKDHDITSGKRMMATNQLLVLRMQLADILRGWNIEGTEVIRDGKGHFMGRIGGGGDSKQLGLGVSRPSRTQSLQHVHMQREQSLKAQIRDLQRQVEEMKVKTSGKGSTAKGTKGQSEQKPSIWNAVKVRENAPTGMKFNPFQNTVANVAMMHELYGTSQLETVLREGHDTQSLKEMAQSMGLKATGSRDALASRIAQAQIAQDGIKAMGAKPTAEERSLHEAAAKSSGAKAPTPTRTLSDSDRQFYQRQLSQAEQEVADLSRQIAGGEKDIYVRNELGKAKSEVLLHQQQLGIAPAPNYKVKMSDDQFRTAFVQAFVQHDQRNYNGSFVDIKAMQADFKAKYNMSPAEFSSRMDTLREAGDAGKDILRLHYEENEEAFTKLAPHFYAGHRYDDVALTQVRPLQTGESNAASVYEGFIPIPFTEGEVAKIAAMPPVTLGAGAKTSTSSKTGTKSTPAKSSASSKSSTASASQKDRISSVAANLSTQSVESLRQMAASMGLSATGSAAALARRIATMQVKNGFSENRMILSTLQSRLDTLCKAIA
jgi:hypothetical protein